MSSRALARPGRSWSHAGFSGSTDSPHSGIRAGLRTERGPREAAALAMKMPFLATSAETGVDNFALPGDAHPAFLGLPLGWPQAVGHWRKFGAVSAGTGSGVSGADSAVRRPTPARSKPTGRAARVSLDEGEQDLPLSGRPGRSAVGDDMAVRTSVRDLAGLTLRPLPPRPRLAERDRGVRHGDRARLRQPPGRTRARPAPGRRPRRFRRAALRWHARYCAEVPDVGFEEAHAVLARPLGAVAQPPPLASLAGTPRRATVLCH